MLKNYQNDNSFSLPKYVCIKVQPLTNEEIDLVNSEEFIKEKKEVVAKKFSKKTG